MSDIVNFFDQFESTLYFILGIGMIGFSIRFFFAWRELRGSVYGLEQINAQRRLNNAAVGMFLLVLMGFMVFSLVTFVQPGLGVNGSGMEEMSPQSLTAENSGEGDAEQTAEQIIDELATATPLPTVLVDPSLCVSDEEAANRIAITSPRTNEEVRGTVEVIGIIDVEDFGFYKLEIAEANTGLWFGISVGESMVVEESVLVVFDSSFYPPGNYVLQLVVTNHDVEEYPPCRIPIRIGQTE
jgi:hypothetical protein